MGYLRSLSVFLAFFACCFIFSTLADKFDVGGEDGWVLHPSQPYNEWAKNVSVHVGDFLVFKYNNQTDTVLQVNKNDYHKCKTEKPIKFMSSGSSFFEIEHDGRFYFISGNKGHCKNGQKLSVVVEAKAPTPAPAPAPSPKIPVPAPPPAPSPKIPVPAPEPSPSYPAPAPAPANSAPSIVFPPSLMVYGIALLVSVVFLCVSQ